MKNTIIWAHSSATSAEMSPTKGAKARGRDRSMGCTTLWSQSLRLGFNMEHSWNTHLVPYFCEQARNGDFLVDTGLKGGAKAGRLSLCYTYIATTHWETAHPTFVGNPGTQIADMWPSPSSPLAGPPGALSIGLANAARLSNGVPCGFEEKGTKAPLNTCAAELCQKHTIQISLKFRGWGWTHFIAQKTPISRGINSEQ